MSRRPARPAPSSRLDTVLRAGLNVSFLYPKEEQCKECREAGAVHDYKVEVEANIGGMIPLLPSEADDIIPSERVEPVLNLAHDHPNREQALLKINAIMESIAGIVEIARDLRKYYATAEVQNLPDIQETKDAITSYCQDAVALFEGIEARKNEVESLLRPGSSEEQRMILDNFKGYDPIRARDYNKFVSLEYQTMGYFTSIRGHMIPEVRDHDVWR